jgi:hypothetical protein
MSFPRYRLSSLAVAVAVAASLSACEAVKAVIPPVPKTPAQGVYEARAAQVTAAAGALAWVKTVCPNQAACNDPRVDAVVDASITADTVISTAEATVRSGTTDQTALQKAATAAQNALSAFQAILTQYGVKMTPTTNGSS